MPTRLTGIPALSYMGVEAPQPPNITFHPRAPLQSDYQNFNTGDLWVDTSNFPPNPPTAENIWMLVSKQNRLGIWVNFSGQAGDLDSLTGDTGGPVFGDANQNINILSGIPGLTVDGNPATNTLTLNSSGGGGLLQTLSADDSPPNVFPDANGDIYLQGTAGNITTAQDALNNSIIFNTGGGVALQYTTDDANSAEPFARNLNVFGINGITTSTPVPGGDTINISGSGTGTSAFMADISASIPNAVGASAIGITIPFDRTYFNIGTDFNTGTGIYTAPVDGLYSFSSSVTLGQLTSSMTAGYFSFSVTGTGPCLGTWGLVRNNAAAVESIVGGGWRFNGSATVQLAAGDEVSVRVAVEGGAGNTATVSIGTPNPSRTWFCGHLVRIL